MILSKVSTRCISCFSYAHLDELGPALYTQTLYKLVTEGYLKPATILSHQSPREKQIRYETEEKDKIPGFPTAKELRQAKEIAYARLKREEEEAEKVGLVSCSCYECWGDSIDEMR